MKKLLLASKTALIAGGILVSAAAASYAQETTVDGAMVMLTEIKGMNKCSKPSDLAAFGGNVAIEAEVLAYINTYKTWTASAEDYRTCIFDTAKKELANLSDPQKEAVDVVDAHYEAQILSNGENINELVRQHNAAVGPE